MGGVATHGGQNEKPAPTLLTHFAREQSGPAGEQSGTWNPRGRPWIISEADQRGAADHRHRSSSTRSASAPASAASSDRPVLMSPSWCHSLGRTFEPRRTGDQGGPDGRRPQHVAAGGEASVPAVDYELRLRLVRGPSGSGKSTIIYNLAGAIADGNAPPSFKERRLVEAPWALPAGPGRSRALQVNRATFAPRPRGRYCSHCGPHSWTPRQAGWTSSRLPNRPRPIWFFV